MIKIIIVSTYYDSYIKQFYGQHPELEMKSYAEQKAALDYDGFAWADFWSHAFRPLGYEVMEVVANIEPLQRAWARENGISFPSKTWLLELPFAQVIKFQPTILFLNDYVTFSYQWISELKKFCPSIRKVMGYCGPPLNNLEVYKAYDLVLSCIPEYVEHVRSEGFNSIHLQHCFEPRLLSRLSSARTSNIDLSFVGSIIRASSFHFERERILLALTSQIPLQIYSPNSDVTWKDKLKTMAKAMVYDIMGTLKRMKVPQSALASLPKIGKAAQWTERPQSQVLPRLRPFMRPAIFGLEMFQTLRNSKITLNIHGDNSPRFASNMRLFEATGVGTCLVTDWKENLGELFIPDEEVVTYRSVEECIEKVKWLMDYSKEREAIAKAGQDRTLRDHTFTRRAQQLDSIIRARL